MRQYRLTREQLGAALGQIKASIGNSPEVQAQIRTALSLPSADGSYIVTLTGGEAWAAAIIANSSEIR